MDGLRKGQVVKVLSGKDDLGDPVDSVILMDDPPFSDALRKVKVQSLPWRGRRPRSFLVSIVDLEEA